MIVNTPQLSSAADELRLEAEIAAERAGAALPRTLWFSFPRACEPFLGDATGAFAVALLPLAMSTGEPLTVRGALSPRLAAGMRTYQRLQAAWKPDLFSEVEVRCDGVVRRDGAGAPAGVGMSFSGGVDSFYTLMTHLPESEPYPASRVSHCLMIDGFDGDSDPSRTGWFRRIQRLYEPVMAARGVELIAVRTNLLEILGPVVRGQSFAAFLTAPALALEGLLARFYIPSGHKVTTLGLCRDGSHQMLDHLLSTETMETSHEDAHLTRFEKTVALARWPETYDRLRVCYGATGVQEGRDAVANCCACEKCLRTMVTLHVAGTLERFTCFPRPLTARAMRNIPFIDEARAAFGREIAEFAARAGRRDVARRLHISLLKSRLLHPAVRPLAGASSRLEDRSRAYRAAVAPPKWLLKRLGFGRGWLY